MAISFGLDLIRGGHVSIMRVPPSECAVFCFPGPGDPNRKKEHHKKRLTEILTSRKMKADNQGSVEVGQEKPTTSEQGGAWVWPEAEE